MFDCIFSRSFASTTFCILFRKLWIILCWNKYHQLLRKMSRLSVLKQLFYRFGFQNVRKFCRYIYNKIAQRIPRSSEWRKDVYITIINLCLFFRSYELLLVKKGKCVNRDTFSYFHFYRSKLLFFSKICVFLLKNY